MDYLTFFGFHDAPFRLPPDPQFFFPSHSHQEALQTLLYSVRAGEGFIQITGDPGTGKTLLLRTMLKELGDDVQTALILNPNLSPQDLLRVILDDFAITNDDEEIITRPKDQLIRLLRDFLLQKAEEGCKAVIIVDEAQNLPLETIEELRLLSNLETDKEKLLQIFLVGQRELEEKIDAPGLRQLSQRITIRYCLMPFSQEESAIYIRHRLNIAAPSNPAIFSTKILALIYRFSQGTPRLINIICERILMAAYIDDQTTITKSHYDNALLSIKGETGAPNRQKNEKEKSTLRNGLIFGLILMVAAGLFVLWQNPQIKEQFLVLFK
ncbi:MAG: AAA family ATPase [Pseudomonadota bacterium]|nr:AAA family ATPase [Pseudomonadota bacterium]